MRERATKRYVFEEFSVVWRWKTDPYHDEFSDERRKVYRTEAGARRLLATLNKNGGEYDKMEDGTGIQTGELIVEHWRLDFARLEHRNVGPWKPLPGSTPTDAPLPKVGVGS